MRAHYAVYALRAKHQFEFDERRSHLVGQACKKLCSIRSRSKIRFAVCAFASVAPSYLRQELSR
jgi:hypothetical protein